MKKIIEQTTETIEYREQKLPAKIVYFILMVIIVGSLALCLSCIGKELPAPFQTTKQWNNASVVAVNSKTTDSGACGTQVTDGASVDNPSNIDETYKNYAYAVIDGNSKTLNIVTKDWDLWSSNSITGVNFTVDKIASAALYGDSVYLSVISSSLENNSTQDEYIIRTNVYGETQEILYEVPKDIETNFKYKDDYLETNNKNAKIKDIKAYEDKVEFCQLNYNAAYVKQISIDKETGNAKDSNQTLATYTVDEYLLGANYSSQNDTLVLLDAQNNVYKCATASGANGAGGTAATSGANGAGGTAAASGANAAGGMAASGAGASAVKIGTSDGCTTNVNLTPDNNVLVLHYGDKPVQVISNDKLQDIDSSVGVYNNPCSAANNSDSDNLKWGEVFLSGYGSIINIGKQVNIGWFYNLKINARWLAICILILALIFAIVMVVRSQLKLMRKGLFKEVTVAVLIGLTAIAVCTTYSVYMYNSAINTAKSQVNQQVNIAYDSISKKDLQSVSEIYDACYSTSSNNAAYNSEAFDSLNNINAISSSIVNEYSKMDNNVFMYSYFAKDFENGQFWCIADSEKAWQSSLGTDSIVNSDRETTTVQELLTNNIDSLRQGKTIDFELNDAQGLSYCSVRAIVNDAGQINGMIMFYAYADTTIKLVMQDIWWLALIVLICYLAFMVAYLEIRRMSIAIRGYKSDKHALMALTDKDGDDTPLPSKEELAIAKRKTKRAFINMIRPLNFAMSLAFGADGALAVLVSKKLFDASQFASYADIVGLQEFMYGLPITITCVGLVLGILIYTVLQKWMYIKSIFVTSAVMFTLSFVLGMFACMFNLYVLFVVAKFFIGFFCGCMKAEFYTFTTLKDVDEDRKTLIRDISRSTMPALVISTLLCGYLTTFVDYYVLYLFAAICSTLVIVLGIIFIPSNVMLCADSSKSSLIRNMKFYSGKVIARWIFSPKVLLVVFFVIIPFAITKGYKSYLFPLYSNSVGLDKATISVIFSVATMVTFLLVHVISDFNNRFKDSRKVINGLCILGFVFVLFRANSRIEWAILAMFLTSIFGRTFGSSFRLGLTRMCAQDGLEPAQIQPYVYLIEEICNASQVVLCGLLIAVGGKFACPIFGVYCLISAIVFGICVRWTHFDTRIK